MDEIGERIKEIREREGLSQGEFGKILGLSGASVSQMENGARKPALQTVLEIAKKFHVTTDFLLQGDVAGDSSLRKLLEQAEKLPVSNQKLLEKIIRVFLDAGGE